MFRVAFSGTRHKIYRDTPTAERICNILGQLQTKHGDDLVVNVGDAEGVDDFVDNVAKNMGITVSVFTAGWDDFGKAAGPIRNREMLECDSKLLLAFPAVDSRGTWSAIKIAVSLKIPVHIYPVEF